ncbi:Ig-like domain repeat protein [Aeromicrobium sp. UC242_57]|uniref:Ig-like domain repeat protein n=1 Tax=Aeromicrobium sp. UC242_57 TaxID=3374624 RepID=UPI0037AFDFD7
MTASANNAGAITAAGKAVIWGQKSPDTADPTDVPADLENVVSLAIANNSAAAVKSNGEVVAWGLNSFGEATVPVGLTGVTSITGGGAQFYALKSDGTVVAWGRTTNSQLALPALLTDTTDSIHVVDVSARAQGGLALMSDGSLVNWGQFSAGTNAIPPALTGKQIAAISTSNLNNNLVLATDGTFATWGQSDGIPELSAFPPSLAGADVAALSIGGQHAIALVTKVLPLAKPTIAGAPTVGQTLTATPSEFSGAPTAVTGQWLADGTEIAGATATTLTLTAAELGKKITYASTATKAPAAPVISISAQTAAVQPDVVASTTAISAPTRAYGSAGTANVTVSNTAGRPVTGTITLTGAGAAQTKAVSGGKATFSLPKNLSPKAYTLTAKYNGSAQVASSTRTARYTVVKGKVRSTTFKATKTPTSKKSGKATVTVTTPSGLAKATGKVTVTIKKGSTKKTIKTTLSGGKRSITLPKLKKGTWKVQVAYAGDKNYGSAKSKSYSLKIKK